MAQALMRADDRALEEMAPAPGQKTDGEDSGYLSVAKLQTQYRDYLGLKIQEIEEQQQSRQYFHGAQWSAADIRILRRRNQPIVTFNSVSRKINAIVGLLERQRQDPKAFPQSPKAERGAELATHAVRYVLDANDFRTRATECGRHAAIDGLSGVELKLIVGDKGDPDIGLDIVYGDDFFYDPRSYKPDFSDARYMGIGKWTDIEEAVELFPEKEDELRGLVESGSDLTTNADREFKWFNSSTKGLRLVEHWYKHRGRWCWCFYVGPAVLDEGESPFYNELNKSICRFIMFSAAVDHDGDRYGFVRNMKGAQDEKNQRRSKALFTANSRRLIMEKGAVDDVETARNEWSRPDGVIEKNEGRDIVPDTAQQQADIAAQFQFLQSAQAELDSFANVAPVMGNGDLPKNISGRAVNLLQQGATAELGPFVISYRDWKLRVYRAVWNMVQRNWSGERFIRVTDPDTQTAQFIQINGLDLDQWGRPVIVNAIGQLDVDINMDEGPDTANMMSDTFDVLSGFPPGTVPWQILLELAPIQGSVKEKIKAMAQPAPPDPLVQQGKIAALGKLVAEGDEKRASASEKRASAMRHVAQAAHAASEANLNARAVYAADTASLRPQQQQPAPMQYPLPGIGG